eukprot:snap_masked-scaffold_59-processed-gene-0.25-mRNA-1 protein AED:1.00 eAED:1.00 QI:0/0/0/0/1/1/4/0/84
MFVVFKCGGGLGLKIESFMLYSLFDELDFSGSHGFGSAMFSVYFPMIFCSSQAVFLFLKVFLYSVILSRVVGVEACFDSCAYLI